VQGELTDGKATLVVPNPPLHSGTYSATIWLTDRKSGTTYAHLPNACTFDYISAKPLPNGYSTEVVGPIMIDAEWTLSPVGPDEVDRRTGLTMST
jgi:hypothetical protein